MRQEIEEKYPGLITLLEDPFESLYLNEGMCERAIQFLEDCIRKHNGELPASDVYEPTSLETYLMMITMDKLIPGYDAANQATFTSAMEGIASSLGMDKVPEWDTHILNQEMIEAQKVYCANRSEEVDTSFVFKLSEKYNYPRRKLGKNIVNFGYSLMLQFYSFNNMNNALITGNNGANTYSIMAGNTLRTDLATLDSATLLAIQRRELLLNNAAGLIVTSNAATMSGSMAQFALQNNLATLNNMAESALKGGSATDLTIMSRNSGRGNPSAITHFDVDLNTRQKNLLQQLPNCNSLTIISKSDVNLKDLAALTAKTGDEFAMFTRGSQRMIIRGNANAVNIDGTMAQKLYNAGFKWSGHTHPGTGVNVKFASEGDMYILEQFNQTQSVIFDSQGNFNVFEIGE